MFCEIVITFIKNIGKNIVKKKRKEIKKMRNNTFNELGTTIDSNTTLINGLPKDFCFDVEKKPLFFDDGTGNMIRLSGTSTVVNKETGKAYGPVSDKYCPIDNATALGSVGYMKDVTLKKYGSTEGGVQWLIGELPQKNILGDKFIPHLVFRNSFNGSTPIQMAVMPLRIVCQNQITMATRESNFSFNLRHTVTANDKIEEGHRLIVNAENFMDGFSKQAEMFASKKVGAIETESIIKEMFPVEKETSELKKRRLLEKRDSFIRAINEADNANFKGTAWGLINAYSDLMTHYEPERKTETAIENKFMTITFDPRWMTTLINTIMARV